MKTNALSSELLAVPIAVLFIMLLSSCSSSIEVKIDTATLAKRLPPPSPIHAALILETAFTNHDPFGDSLRRYAEGSIRSIFQRVDVLTDSINALNKADVIILPRLVRENVLIRMRERKDTIAVEWTIKDPTNTKIYWLTTIVSAATGATGEEQPIYQKMFDSLVDKTIKSFSESPEIQRLPITKPTPSVSEGASGS